MADSMGSGCGLFAIGKRNLRKAMPVLQTKIKTSKRKINYENEINIGLSSRCFIAEY